MSAIREQEQSQDRVVRRPFSGPQLKLQMSAEDRQAFKDRGMVPRWFNDQESRIARAEGAGYQFVTPKQVPSLGSGVIHGGNTDIGSKVSLVVSKGEPVIRAYLLEISQEFFDEDQAAKESVNALVDEALALGGHLGSDLENEYKPA